ncbi:DUF2235 domain-containing protein, partial [Telmatospirillum sp.]|uniref:DUF2235 domain-containing protein n=1 Tax=Telmatospirillum sp. TaxID=2079197 RepID=UPI00284090E1
GCLTPCPRRHKTPQPSLPIPPPSSCARDRNYLANADTGQYAGRTPLTLFRQLGGALGAGVITRIVRGYTFLSRNHNPGDRIVLVGFSRGAYTVRALAGLIVTKGLIDSAALAKNDAYQLGAAAWYAYRHDVAARKGFLTHLADIVDNLPGFVSDAVPASAWVRPVEVGAIGVWDTVGALGIPEYRDDEREDVFAFADTILGDHVRHGFHAISLDDQRKDFAPTLWQPRINVVQRLFPGAHADVGGGYPAGQESGLSNVALNWMTGQLSNLTDIRIAFAQSAPPGNALGIAHQPWLSGPFALRPTGSRTFCRDYPGIAVHASVFARIDHSVKADPTLDPAAYYPTPCAACDNKPTGPDQACAAR